MEIITYTEEKRREWEDFVTAAKNGSFHQTRKFLDYHGDRFEDASVMVYEKSTLIACVPAAKIGTCFFAHPGLTYGGIIIAEDCYLTAYLRLFRSLMLQLEAWGYTECVIKDVPGSYCSTWSDELAYSMHLGGGVVRSFDVLPHLHPTRSIPYQKRRERAIKKALAAGIRVESSSDLPAYWSIVQDVLSRYGASPVHSLEEISVLQQSFPENIRLYGAFSEKQLLSGILVFDTGRVMRAQYIASSDEGRQSGALDLVFDRLINLAKEEQKVLEFGTTTTERGIDLNYGLSDQKEGFGARSLVHLSYSLELANFRAERFPTEQ